MLHFLFRFFLLFLCLSCPVLLSAQFGKANTHFKEKRFAAAIPLYEAGLEKKNSLLAKTRLAFSYRMLNQMDKAETLYATIVEEPRARKETMRYYAEALMSNAKYDEAKSWFLKYLEQDPQDSVIYQYLEACAIAPTIKPFFTGLVVKEFSQNSEEDDNSPMFFNGSIVFTSDRPAGKLLKQKSGFTGRDYLRLYETQYSKEKNTFATATEFSSKINAFNKNTANPSFTADRKIVYFSQNSDVGTERGEYKLQLYEAQGNGKGKWRSSKRLSFCKTDFNYMHPAVSADGNTLYFISDIKGEGGFDIFRADKNGNDWGRPQNIGLPVNSAGHEAFPFVHADGRLFFSSKGLPGFGGFDIFMSAFDSTSQTWSKPVNLGRPINSPVDDISFSLAANDSTGLFASSRSGGDDDIFIFWLKEKKYFEAALAPILEESDESNLSSDFNTLFSETDAARSNLEALKAAIESGQSLTDATYYLNNAVYSNITETAVPIAAASEVSSILAILEKNPNISLQLGVHCNAALGKKAAQQLSDERAAAWTKLLLGSGADANRLTVKGHGTDIPMKVCADCPIENVERIEIKASTK